MVPVYGLEAVSYFNQCTELELFYNHVKNLFTVNDKSRLGPCKLRCISSALAVIASFAKQLILVLAVGIRCFIGPAANQE